MIDFDGKYFEISNGSTTLVLSLFKGNVLFRYIGKKIDVSSFDDEDLFMEESFAFDTLNATLPYLVPTSGHGDYRQTQLGIRDGKSICSKLVYLDHEIIEGKNEIEGLPHLWGDDCSTLIIRQKDEVKDVIVESCISLFDNLNAFVFSTRILNGRKTVTLDEFASSAITLNDSFSMIHLEGAWARERSVEKIPPMEGIREICSKRGASGHQHNPFVALVDRNTDEDSGRAIGINLLYSGNFRITVEQDSYHRTRVISGMDAEGQWTLEPGEVLQLPETVCVYSEEGLGHMSRTFHELYMNNLMRSRFTHMDRPVLVNNWEATFFDFDDEKLISIARCAKKTGADLFVIDDGWFGHRDDDHSSLGDWYPDRRKFPQGLERVSDAVRSMGLQFGIWFEPEMISEDSDLYEARPDWLVDDPSYSRTPGRHQYLLDLTNREARDYVIGRLDEIIRRNHVTYIKWDMNRNFTEYTDAMFPHRYILGLYDIFERITAMHPEVLFEGCSGGGGRFDAGILYYMPQIWTSDNSDPASRMRIHYGTSMCYPIPSMTIHYCASPNNVCGRHSSSEVRNLMGLNGTFGYELDLTELDEDTLSDMKLQIERVRELGKITREGKLYRLRSPFEGNVCSFEYVYGDDVLLFVFQMMQFPDDVSPIIRLRGIREGRYRLDGTDRVYDSSFLMNRGVLTDLTHIMGKGRGDFSGTMYHFTREK